MKLTFIELLILLLIFLALALPGSQGISFSGISNGESVSANVHASTVSAAGVSYGRGDLHFFGDGDAKFSRKYSTGSTWSQVGCEIKDADNYDGHIGGSKNAKAKTTSAYLDLLAEGAEYIYAYGKSGTTKNIGSGVEMTVEDGDADISIKTQADGKAVTSESSLDTNADDDGLDIIRGSHVDIKGYYTGSKGGLKVEIDYGSIEGYHLWTGGSRGGSRAEQSAGYAFGDIVEFTTNTKETVSGKTRELAAGMSITDGYVEGYHSGIDDHARLMSHSASQGFDEAGTTEEMVATTSYVETTKNAKKRAEESAHLSSGFMTSYSSGAADAYPYQSPHANQNAGYAEGNYIDFNNHYTEVSKKASRHMYSDTAIYEGSAEDFQGKSESAEESGTEHTLGLAQGMNIYLNNRYEDNLRSKGGFGSANVLLGDPVVMQGGEDLIGSLTDYTGKAKFTTTDVGTTMDVKAQGHTDLLDVDMHAFAYYNKFADDHYAADDWENYFIAEAKSASPWTVSINKGHQLQDGETIQQVINWMPHAEGNIFLKETTYNEHDIVNNANIANGEVGFTLWGAGSYLNVWDEDGHLVPAGNSVIDADTSGDGIGEGRIFDLYSAGGDRTFTFKNIDFNNGNNANPGSLGGAINIRLPGTDFTLATNIERSGFNDNHADFGGAICNAGSILNIKNSAFDSNSATIAGGAIDNYQGTTNIQDSSFTSNTAVISGGAIANEDYQGNPGDLPSKLTLEGCTFTDNLAGYFGGAIGNACYGNSIAESEVTVASSQFTGNHASFGGGAIAATGGTITTASGNSFQDNYAGVLPTPNGKGGAIYILLNGVPAEFNDVGNTYSGNQPDDVKIDP